MKKLRWPLLIVVLALIAIGALLLSQPKASPPATPLEVKPVTGGVYTEGIVGAINRLNPLLDMYNPGDMDVDRLIFSGLIRFDEHGLPVGDLAESWGISLDGKIYNFSLRSNATWHDGKPVLSDDVIFTIDLMKDVNSIFPDDVKKLWGEVSIQRLDDKTIQFRLPEPYAPFLDYLSFGVLPKHLLDGLTFEKLVAAPYNMQPVGSGPYRFDHFVTDNGQITGVALAANKDYYNQPPFIEKLVFLYYPDAQSALVAYQKGEIMGISRVPPELLPQVLKDPELSIYTGRFSEMTLVFLNLNNPEVPFLKEPKVRRALLMGINRQLMIDSLLQGQAIIADGPILPGTWAYYEGIEHLGYDPETALSLLKGIGYTIPAAGGSIRADKDGKLIKLELLYPDDASHKAIAEMIQESWTKLGVGVTLTALPYNELVSGHLETRLYQAALVDLNLARSPDPDPYPFWHQTQVNSGQNYSNWDDFQASEYLEQARIVTDLGERARYYRNFQVRFSQELPALPLFYPVYTYAVKSEVQGVSIGNLFDSRDRFTSITSWYLVTTRATVEAVTPTPTP